jgi:hypothetical protein
MSDSGFADWYEKQTIAQPGQSNLVMRPNTLPNGARNLVFDWLDLVAYRGDEEKAVELACDIDRFDSNPQKRYALIEEKRSCIFTTWTVDGGKFIRQLLVYSDYQTF